MHRTGQFFFMRVEALFNLAFGERLNPLYYLGAISYLLTWIAVGSGIYLYVFFSTGDLLADQPPVARKLTRINSAAAGG